MSERTKNQLKQASSILLITDFQAFTDFTQSISFFFFFYYGEQTLIGPNGWMVYT